MHKRGQYFINAVYSKGFLFLVFVIVVASLIYNGILTPRNVLPELCLAGNIGCSDFSVSIPDGTVSVFFVNNLAQPVRVVNITAFDSERTCIADFSHSPVLFKPHSVLNATLACAGVPFSDGKVVLNLRFRYFNSVSVIQFARTIEGRIIVRPQG